jgi:hypothetical protein
MDFNGFNKVTYPNYYAKQPRTGTEYRQARRLEVTPSMEPPKDNRYEAYAGPMAEAAFGTDYRPHCSYNLPPGTQFNTKQWMVAHADSLIHLTRQRQSEWTGASLPMAKTVPPPADVVFSSPFENEVVATHYRNGLGVERMGAEAPSLFGTFVVPPTPAEIQSNVKHIALTTNYQGGRNSIRGINNYIH